ncbi:MULTISPECIES: low molecular weight protein-tyrosine-phosphatase [unclassified Marinobacter]|uniref:low molecular weight protein-tyrosine-phosphatase n=1 Tax=unclassified Marinobacter TaxID=83889 RepID=UPI0026E2933D|nr:MULTISPECIES: low molecular weight protein-tyrosine-phosphatase [unclassified Marinobacter]MDO6440553.1 low molecular weight protein-tyrosine-phosphatase [Marinobacter sp. 2_MG-2023]MDO6823381.1 low molecular weight protein-tyrosine-phosphatase [Marinobacter sp. 1_MG-2023]
MSKPASVLFVCLGNICRSPTAEGVFRKLVEQAGLQDRIYIDSCGTSNWHIGKGPDQRSQEAALKRGFDISALKARQFTEKDLDTFDYVVVMDRQNLADVKDIWHQNGGTQPKLFLEYGRSGLAEVPDPYFGGEDGFEEVLDLIEEAGEGLLRNIQERLA